MNVHTGLTLTALYKGKVNQIENEIIHKYNELHNIKKEQKMGA